MKAVDFRNFTWAQVQEHIGDDMRRVHDAWRDHGPGTTRQIAERSGISLLTFRPRTTDLYHLGLVECVGCESNAGVYRFVSEDEARAAEKWKQEPKRTQKQEPRATAGLPPTPNAELQTRNRRSPTASEVSHAASILARARAHRRAKPTGRNLIQPELFAIASAS